ncbi:MAG: hypothetical protein M1449_13890 [Candidatus Thermoplasmatota archaeon]|nr:hypothetical protein [Candidatus Thermoplasmatota archaeon]
MAGVKEDAGSTARIRVPGGAPVANSPDAVVVHDSATERRAQADAEIAD